jgi:hypothetical protein
MPRLMLVTESLLSTNLHQAELGVPHRAVCVACCCPWPKSAGSQTTSKQTSDAKNQRAKPTIQSRIHTQKKHAHRHDDTTMMLSMHHF